MAGTDPWAVGFALPWTDPRCGCACALLLAGGGPGPYGRFHFGAGPVCCTSARVPIGSGSTEETVAPGSSLAIRTSTMNGRPSLCLSTPGKGRLACRFPRFGSIRSVDEKRRYTSLRQKPCVFIIFFSRGNWRGRFPHSNNVSGCARQLQACSAREICHRNHANLAWSTRA
jgi:hypothetical protein